MSDQAEGLKKVYTVGYTGRRPAEIVGLAKELGAIVVDIRYQPCSRNPVWNKNRLQESMAGRYYWMRDLGNENYKGGPMKLMLPETGTQKAAALLSQSPIILMCACTDAEKCHRKKVAEMLASELGVEVEHLMGDLSAGEAQPAQMALF